MHNNNAIQDYRDLLQVYPEDTVAEEMVDMLSRVIRYYRNGDLYYSKHFRPKDRVEYKDHMAFLRTLRDLAEAMCTEEERSLIIQDENVKLNLNEWINFLHEANIPDILLMIQAIKSIMADYLHEDNITEYRDCLQIIESWERLLREMV